MAEEPLEDEKQEPVKPEKPKKQKVGLSLPIIIGGIAGIVILLFAAVILGGFVATKLFAPESGENTEKVEKKPLSPEERHFDNGNADEEDEEKNYFEEHPSKFAETGRITTNPKNSSQFVVINLGLEFREETTEEEGGGHAEGGTETLPPKILARIKGVVIQMLGSMTIMDLQQQREKLPEMLLEKIKPIFLEYRHKKMYLRDLVIVEFIVQ